ncbi:MAG: hypothetical protein H0Z39_10195 [Peptococcaceae bacterium]|nr:hypothetical protein [Peptococcaceae bacterium]
MHSWQKQLAGGLKRKRPLLNVLDREYPYAYLKGQTGNKTYVAAYPCVWLFLDTRHSIAEDILRDVFDILLDVQTSANTYLTSTLTRVYFNSCNGALCQYETIEVDHHWNVDLALMHVIDNLTAFQNGKRIHITPWSRRFQKLEEVTRRVEEEDLCITLTAEELIPFILNTLPTLPFKLSYRHFWVVSANPHHSVQVWRNILWPFYETTG